MIYVDLKGPTSKGGGEGGKRRGREGKGRGGERGEEGKGKGGRKGEEKRKGGERDLAPRKKSWLRHWVQQTLSVAFINKTILVSFLSAG